MIKMTFYISIMLRTSEIIECDKFIIDAKDIKSALQNSKRYFLQKLREKYNKNFNKNQIITVIAKYN